MKFYKSPQTTIVLDPEIQKFLEGILVETNLYTSDAIIDEHILEEMYIRFIQYLNVRIIQMLPSHCISDFQRMLESDPTQAQIDVFVREYLPDSDESYRKIFVEFREFYLNGNQYM